MKKILIVGAALLIVVVALALVTRGGNGPEPTPTPTPPPTPTVTPTVTPTPIPGVIEVTAGELIQQLLANPNGYPRGTVIQVSGELDMRVPIDTGWATVAHLLEPASAAETKYFVIILVENFFTIGNWPYAPLTSEVTVRGKYNGFYVVETINDSINPEGPVLIEPILISSSK